MSLYVLQSLACSEVGVAGEQEALEADDELPDIVQAAALPLPGLALAPAMSRLLDCLLCRQPGMCHQCSLGNIVAAELLHWTARAPCCGHSTRSLQAGGAHTPSAESACKRWQQVVPGPFLRHSCLKLPHAGTWVRRCRGLVSAAVLLSS